MPKKIVASIIAALFLALVFAANAYAIAEMYTVEPGDTLWKIATTNGLSVSELLEYNPHIHNPNLIFPCEIIQLQPAHFSEQDEVARLKAQIEKLKAQIEELKNEILNYKQPDICTILDDSRTSFAIKLPDLSTVCLLPINSDPLLFDKNMSVKFKQLDNCFSLVNRYGVWQDLVKKE